MKIGIVSDSHGRDKRLQAAMDLLAARGVEAVVHCGDIGSERCMEILGGWRGCVVGSHGSDDPRTLSPRGPEGGVVAARLPSTSSTRLSSSKSGPEPAEGSSPKSDNETTAPGGADVPAYAAAGNMDRHLERLEEAATRCGVHFAWEVVELPLGDGRYLVATHGHDPRVLAELIAGGEFPYVCHGHTHRVRDERVGPVRVINPGALHSSRAPGYPTVAILDTATDSLEIVPVPK